MIADSRNVPFIVNQPEEEMVDIHETDGGLSVPEQAI
jgi:hypothetical protein